MYTIPLSEIFFFFDEINKGRFLIPSRVSPLKIIDESYNSNPLSLKFAVHKFNKIKINNKRKNILLGDMLELGKFSKNLHQNIVSELDDPKISIVITVGKYSKVITE